MRKWDQLQRQETLWTAQEGENWPDDADDSNTKGTKLQNKIINPSKSQPIIPNRTQQEHVNDMGFWLEKKRYQWKEQWWQLCRAPIQRRWWQRKWQWDEQRQPQKQWRLWETIEQRVWSKSCEWRPTGKPDYPASPDKVAGYLLRRRFSGPSSHRQLIEQLECKVIKSCKRKESW